MIALLNGKGPESLKTSGGAVYICTISARGLTGSGKRLMAPMCGPRWGEKEGGPNPTDRAKSGMKDHVLSDGRGVPLSVVVTAANVNDGPMLHSLLDNQVIVRPVPTTQQPQHLCLDAGFDSITVHAVLLRENYQGHIAPKRGRDESLPLHPGGKARRWVVERLHAWHDRFRRLVNNWEKKVQRHYAFLCLANALIAYRS
jgi:putative transposase